MAALHTDAGQTPRTRGPTTVQQQHRRGSAAAQRRRYSVGGAVRGRERQPHNQRPSPPCGGLLTRFWGRGTRETVLARHKGGQRAIGARAGDSERGLYINASTAFLSSHLQGGLQGPANCDTARTQSKRTHKCKSERRGAGKGGHRRTGQRNKTTARGPPCVYTQGDVTYGFCLSRGFPTLPAFAASCRPFTDGVLT